MPRGEKNKLTTSDIEAILELRGKKSGYSVAEDFNVSPTMIYKIWNNPYLYIPLDPSIDESILKKILCRVSPLDLRSLVTFSRPIEKQEINYRDVNPFDFSQHEKFRLDSLYKKTYSTPYRQNYNILIIGEGAAGKMTLLTRYLDGYFDKNMPKTAMQFKKHQTTLKDVIKGSTITMDEIDDHSLSFNYWKMGGQSMFDELRSNYLAGTQGIILTFALTDERALTSFRGDRNHIIRRFLKQLVDYFDKKTLRSIPVLLVGTKEDLIATESNKKEEIIEKANKIATQLKKSGINLVQYSKSEENLIKVLEDKKQPNENEDVSYWLPISSKTGKNVSLMFKLIEIAVLSQYEHIKKFKEQMK
jgi:GTPase SAR1 family protein